jgi:hypothetical protein
MDLLNTPSAFKRAYGSWKGKKEDLRSELARGFSLVACNLNNKVFNFSFVVIYFNLFSKQMDLTFNR